MQIKNFINSCYIEVKMYLNTFCFVKIPNCNRILTGYLLESLEELLSLNILKTSYPQLAEHSAHIFVPSLSKIHFNITSYLCIGLSSFMFSDHNSVCDSHFPGVCYYVPHNICTLI
jgi:hypothetical protein